jgi:hypothetical protein
VGNSTAATLTEIEQTRSRLERDMAELAGRLPAPAIWLKRLAGVAVGGGVGGSLFWFVAHRIRNRAKKAKEQKAEKAEKALKNVPAAVTQSPVVQVLPPEWGERLGELLETGQWKGPAIAIGTVWVLLRWMELRRLKRLTKAILSP